MKQLCYDFQTTVDVHSFRSRSGIFKYRSQTSQLLEDQYTTGLLITFKQLINNRSLKNCIWLLNDGWCPQLSVAIGTFQKPIVDVATLAQLLNNRSLNKLYTTFKQRLMSTAICRDQDSSNTDCKRLVPRSTNVL